MQSWGTWTEHAHNKQEKLNEKHCRGIIQAHAQRLEKTEVYINLEETIFGDVYNQEFHVRVGSTSEEIKAILEVGYEFVCEKDGLMFFRKRK